MLLLFVLSANAIGKGLIMQFYHGNLNEESDLNFRLASKLMPDVEFKQANCSEKPEFCEKYRLEVPYAIQLISPKREMFADEDVAFEIIEFLEKNTDHKRTVSSNLVVVNQSTFNDCMKQKMLLAFLDLDNRQSQIMIPQLEQLAYIFHREKSISVGYINCRAFLDVCLTYGVEAAPIIQAFNTNVSEFSGAREFGNLLSFANEKFATHRRSDGELNQEAGILKEAVQIVQNFMINERKRPQIEHMKNIPRTEYYVHLMKRMLNNGTTALDLEYTKYKEMESAFANNHRMIDDIKTNLNIIRLFQNHADQWIDESEL